MQQTRKRAALITGASSGIGEAYARALASRGDDLVLVARSADKLERIASELRARTNVTVHVVPADLKESGAAAEIFAATEALEVDIHVLINNAGFATHGRFEELPLERELEEIMVNVYAVVALTRLYLPRMLRMDDARIINVASTAAFQPLPYMAVYGATKAFVLSFSEALWGQLADSTVSVLAVCPGPVATNFFEVVSANEARVGKPDTAEHVVEVSLRAAGRRRSHVIPRMVDYLMANAARFLPRPTVARTTERVLRPRSVPRLRADNGVHP
jgi:uncharacterized protein